MPARRPLFAGLMLTLLAIGCGPQGESSSHQARAASPSPAPTGDPSAAAPPAPVSAAAVSRAILPLPDLGYNAREGRALYRHYCATCHGAEGHGDGFNAYNLDPKPRDLADPAFQARKSDDDLASVVRSGGGFAGLSTAMPPWGRTLNERKVRNIIEYLRTLAKPPASRHVD